MTLKVLKHHVIPTKLKIFLPGHNKIGLCTEAGFRNYTNKFILNHHNNLLQSHLPL